MANILAIETDPRQAGVLKRIVRDHVHAHLAVVTSKDQAIAAIDAQRPDLVLLSALLSPRDEEEIVARLRGLGRADHLQTLTLPRLEWTPADEEGGGRLRGLFKRRRSERIIAGCDPERFAEEIISYLQRAEEIKAERAEIEAAARATTRGAEGERPAELPVEEVAPVEGLPATESAPPEELSSPESAPMQELVASVNALPEGLLETESLPPSHEPLETESAPPPAMVAEASEAAPLAAVAAVEVEEAEMASAIPEVPKAVASPEPVPPALIEEAKEPIVGPVPAGLTDAPPILEPVVVASPVPRPAAPLAAAPEPEPAGPAATAAADARRLTPLAMWAKLEAPPPSSPSHETQPASLSAPAERFIADEIDALLSSLRIPLPLAKVGSGRPCRIRRVTIAQPASDRESNLALAHAR